MFAVKVVIILVSCSFTSSVKGAWYSSSPSDEVKNVDPYDYGVDVTYPVHHYIKENTFF